MGRLYTGFIVYSRQEGWKSQFAVQPNGGKRYRMVSIAIPDQSHLHIIETSICSHGRTYDWNSHIVPGTPLDRLDFVPMAWGPGSIDAFAADSANFDALGVSHLLSFNEPDVSCSPNSGLAHDLI